MASTRSGDCEGEVFQRLTDQQYVRSLLEQEANFLLTGGKPWCDCESCLVRLGFELGHCGPEAVPALNALIARFGHVSDRTKHFAVASLNRIAGKEATYPPFDARAEKLAHLTAVLLDRKSCQCEECIADTANALAEYGVDAVPVLVNTLAYRPRFADAESIADALGKVGAGAVAAIPALNALFQDQRFSAGERELMRPSIENALQRIDQS